LQYVGAFLRLFALEIAGESGRMRFGESTENEAVQEDIFNGYIQQPIGVGAKKVKR
jgi:hypothetical protein